MSEFCDGDVYLLALKVTNTEMKETIWEAYKLRIFVDDYMQLYYADDHEICGDHVLFDSWAWEDFEYYIKLSV